MQSTTRLQAMLNAFSGKSAFNAFLVKLICAPLFWILLISGITRGFYYSVLLTTRSNDTTGYVNYKANILLGQTEGLRTPVYPYFIKLIGLISDKANLLDNVVTAQIIISFLGIIIFYKIARAIFKSQKIVNTSSLLYGLMLPVINFDKMVLTESLSVVSGLIFIYLLVRYLQKPDILKAVMTTMFVFIAIMLRPSFIYLLPMVVVFWVLRLLIFRKNIKACLAGLVASSAVWLLICGYSALNEKNAHFNGISVVSNNNGLAVVIGANIYQSGNDPAITAAIDSNIAEQRKIAKGQKIETQNFIVPFKPDRIHRFISTCIRNQPYAFFVYICGKMIDIQSLNIFTNYAEHKLNPRAYRIENIEYFLFFVPFSMLFLFLEANAVFIIVGWIRTKQVPWLKLSLWGLVSAQIFIALAGGFSEYPRLILPAMPGLILLFFDNLDRLVFAIDTTKLKNYPASI